MKNRLSTLLNTVKIAIGYKGLPESDIKNTLKSVATRSGHKAYEFLLRRCDSGINFINNEEIANKTFIGDGYGEGSLNTYRKIEMIDKTVLFEKIYYIDSMDYKKLCFFYDKVYDNLIRNGVSTPFLYTVLEGDLFAVVYISFVELNDIDPDEYEITAINLAQIIKKIETEPIDEKNNFLFDLDSSFMFKIGLNRLYHLTSNDYMIKKTIKSVYSYVIKQDRFLQHGDLNPRNIHTNYLIDWDEFGMYPEGYDIGFILCYGQRIRGSFFNREQIDTIIEKFSPTNTINLLFFIIVFSCKYDLFESKEVLIKYIDRLFYIYENQ